MHRAATPRTAGGESFEDLVNNFERELITAVLQQNHFSLNRTAEQLKMSRHSLRYRMQRLNIAADADLEEEPAPAAKDLSP